MSPPDRAVEVVVAGFGSPDRHDDGVGPLVASLVADGSAPVKNIGPLSDPLDLLGHWNRADLVIVVDALRSGAPAGTIRVLELDVDLAGESSGSDDTDPGVTSTHGIGLAGVVRLARAIGQGPSRLVVVGVEGEVFGFGEGLSPAVAAAVPEAVTRVLSLIREVESCA